MIWRDIKVRYKQTVLGGLWAVLQPFIGTLIFGILFTTVAPVKAPGAPYPLFVYAGLVPWTFFANALSLSSNSLIGSEQMIRKTYLPRIFLPMGATLGLVMDMLIGFALMTILFLYYRWPITPALLYLPLFIIGTFFAAAGLGLILSALNVYFRDIKYVVPFLTQMLFFLTPVVYPSDRVPASLRPILVLNPMTGMEEGFRHALLGLPVPVSSILVSSGIAAVLLVIGLYVFRRMERTFADLI